MIELKKDEYNNVFSLVENLENTYLLALTIIENKTGRIFVNNETNPSSYLNF